MLGMASLDTIFNSWETLTEMASDIRSPVDRIEKWKERSNIPSKYWPSVLSALRSKGKDLSADDLLRMHTAARRRA